MSIWPFLLNFHKIANFWYLKPWKNFLYMANNMLKILIYDDQSIFSSVLSFVKTYSFDLINESFCILQFICFVMTTLVLYIEGIKKNDCQKVIFWSKNPKIRRSYLTCSLLITISFKQDKKHLKLPIICLFS